MMNKRIYNILLSLLAISLLFSPTIADAACVKPDGAKGVQIFNTKYNLMQYCNGAEWINMGAAGKASSSVWLFSGANNIYFNTGSVGIGTDNPQSVLDVLGKISATSLSTTGAITAGGTLNVTGAITADNNLSVAGEMLVSDIFTAQDMIIAESAILLADETMVITCMNPGEIRYNNNNSSVEVCNGSVWKLASASSLTGDIIKAADSTNTTIAPDAVELGTDTTGNYVENIIVSGDGIGVSGTLGEGWTATISNTGDTTPDTIADDNFIDLATEITGTLPAGNSGELTGDITKAAGTSAAAITDNAVTSTHILDGTIAATDIATGAVTSDNIADGTITSSDIANDAVTSLKIADGTITATDIADGAITSTNIADGTIASIDIADGAITSTDIADGTIASSDIADSAITSTNIEDATITAADIASGAVTSTNIADDTITTLDIADNAITSAKIEDGAIASDDIADGAVQLGVKTFGTYDATPDSIADDGFIDLTTEVTGILPVTSGGTGQDTALILDSLDDVTIASPTVNQMLVFDGTDWINIDRDATWESNIDDSIYYNLGNVGIGTNAPEATLHVSGIIKADDAIRLANDTSVTACAAEQTGDIRYNATKESIEVCSGSEWKSSSAGGFIEGSIPFANAEGDLIEDNANLKWDDASQTLIVNNNITAGADITVGNKVKFTGVEGGEPSQAEGADILLGDLGDVVLTTPSSNQVLTYSSGNWINQSLVSEALTGDVTKDAGSTVTTIASGAVTEAKIADGAIDLAGTKITGTLAATNSSVITGEIQKSAGSSVASIAVDAVDSNNIADGAVGTADIEDGSVGTIDIADNAITNAKIADGTIGTADLANDAVTNTKIADGTIGTADIANDAITTAKIDDGTVGSADLADSAVTAAKVANDAVALGTKTTGNYMASVAASTGISVSGTAGEGWTATITNTGDTVADSVAGKVDLDNTDEINGTLAVANGGTGLTSITAGQILYGSGTSAIGSENNLSWDSTNGRLVIGNATTPAYTLDVNGNAGVRTDLRVFGSLYLGTGASRFYVDSGTRIYTPNDFYVNNSNTYIYGDNTYLGASSGDIIQLRGNQLTWTSGSGGIIDTAGNVGIGDSTPDATLDVSGNIIAGSSSSSTNAGVIDSAGGIVTYNPTMGIDTSGKATTTTRSGILFGSNHATNNAMFWITPDASTGNKLHIGNGSTFADGGMMTIKHSGPVGIGNTNPTEKLEVSGNIKMSGYLVGDDSLTISSPATPIGPSSNVRLMSGDNLRDIWIYLDKAGLPTSNWGIYHRNIDSTTSEDVPANSIAFVGGGSGATNAFINLANGNMFSKSGYTVRKAPAMTAEYGMTFGGSFPSYSVTYPYETISLHPDNNLRFWFGNTERFVFRHDGPAYKSGGGSWAALASDARLKENIIKIDSSHALDKITKMRGVSYNWINPELHSEGLKYGFIAQDVKKVFPQWVTEAQISGADEDLIDDDNPLTINFSLGLEAYMIESIKELANKHDAKDALLEKQQQEIDTLKSEIEELKALIKGAE